MNNLILGIVGLVIGAVAGYLVRTFLASKKVGTAETRAEKILLEAKNKQNELLLEAKEKSLKMSEASKKEDEARRVELRSIQARLEKRESLFDQKLLAIETKHQEIATKEQDLETSKEEIKKIRADQISKLEKVASLTQEEAKLVLFARTEAEVKDEIVSRINKIQDEASEEMEKKAKLVLANVIQRCAVSHATEVTTTSLDLPSDEMKGRIIGKEGRNIKAIEQMTGVEIIVDDTPNMITISSFSPIRRHVAKRALEKLILDGRIHPTKIEAAVELAKKEIALDIKKAGEEATAKAGIIGLDPKLLQIMGRLKYRTSYGQNVLQHSIEVAHLSALLAEELGGNVNVARKGGFLHDVGKSVDHDVQGTHPEIGMHIGKKFNLPEEILLPIGHHHDDRPPSLETLIVKVADAISGGRPGARNDSVEQYLQRLSELENVATSFTGVEKAYAIQAGREIRVFVTPSEVDDLQAMKLARDIANRIEAELKYPGEIKVNLIRDMRIVEYAR
ncbi:ribonuclease Y [Candidatus Uhrbacteria bacterium]|nr:ribonuclease Y [Candidatus Uhrbacteria bacterium]